MKTHLMKELRQKFPCSFCGKTFTQSGNVRTHERNLHSGVVKEFECQCGRVFTSYSSLYMHKRSVHEKKRDDQTYPCSKCDKTFKLKVRLKEHIQTHHEPRQPCEICGNMVPTGTAYRSHVKRHSKRYQCKYPGCYKEFTRSASVGYHYKTVHTQPEQVSCHICNATFSVDDKLKQHIKRQHQTEKVKCILPECDFTTLRKKFLAAHYEKHAKVDGNWRENLQQHLAEVKFHRIKNKIETSSTQISLDEPEVKQWELSQLWIIIK